MHQVSRPASSVSFQQFPSWQGMTFAAELPRQASDHFPMAGRLLLFALCCVGGCRLLPATPQRDATAPVQTDAVEYRWRRDGAYEQVRFVATLHNSTGDTLRFAPCGAGPLITWERLEGGAWREAYGAACHAVGVPPITLAPGATRRDTIHPIVSTSRNMMPEFVGRDVGVFRLVYTLTTTTSESQRLVSNAFRVVR